MTAYLVSGKGLSAWKYRPLAAMGSASSSAGYVCQIIEHLRDRNFENHSKQIA
jgi:hypothetical protein